MHLFKKQITYQRKKYILHIIVILLLVVVKNALTINPDIF